MKRVLMLAGLFVPLLACAGPSAQSESLTPGFNTAIPPQIMTLDSVETKYLGSLEFSDGRPSTETADKIYDHLAYLRGVEVFLNLMPGASY